MTMKQRLCAFYQSNLFSIAFGLILFFGHITSLEPIFSLLASAAMILGLFVAEDIGFLLMPACSFLMIVSAKGYSPSSSGYERFYNTPTALVLMLCAVVSFWGCLIVYLIKHRSKTNSAPKSRVFFSLFAVAAVLFLGGAFSNTYTPQNMIFAASISAALLVCYLIFHFYYRFDRQSLDRFAFVLVTVGMLILAELAWAYATRVEFVDGKIVKDSILLGWGVWTNVGGMLCFLMPICFYFAAKKKNGCLWFIPGLLEFVGVLLSQSRGAILVGAGVLFLSLLLLCFRSEQKKIYRMLLGGLVAVAILGAALLFGKITDLWNRLFNGGIGDNGRFELWQTGWKNFLSHPVFGSGFYNSCENPGWNRFGLPSMYHNTPIEMLAATGVVGFGVYAWHRVETVLLAWKTRKDARIFFSLAVLALLLFSLADVLFFKIYPTVIYGLILLFLEQSEKE